MHRHSPLRAGRPMWDSMASIRLARDKSERPAKHGWRDKLAQKVRPRFTHTHAADNRTVATVYTSGHSSGPWQAYWCP